MVWYRMVCMLLYGMVSYSVVLYVCTNLKVDIRIPHGMIYKVGMQQNKMEIWTPHVMARMVYMVWYGMYT